MVTILFMWIKIVSNKKENNETNISPLGSPIESPIGLDLESRLAGSSCEDKGVII